MKKLIMALFLFGYGIVPLFAQSQIWKIDPVHSSVKFAVKHMLITEVVGKFSEYEATLSAQKNDFSDAILEVSINIQSIDTDDKKRDAHLNSMDFFNSEKYPKMSFKSKSVEFIDDNNLKFTGDLTINGIKKTVVFEGNYGGTIVDPYGNTRSGWHASTTINRFDYGMKFNGVLDTGGLVVGKDIKINIDAQFILQK